MFEKILLHNSIKTTEISKKLCDIQNWSEKKKRRKVLLVKIPQKTNEVLGKMENRPSQLYKWRTSTGNSPRKMSVNSRNDFIQKLIILSFNVFFFHFFYCKTIDSYLRSSLLISNVTNPKNLSFRNFHYQYLLTLT